MRLRAAILVSATVLGFGLVAAQEEGQGTPSPAAPAALEDAKSALRSGDYQKAFDASEAALQEAPDNLVAHYIAGLSLLRLGRLDEAGAHLDAVNAQRPDFPGLNFQYGFLEYARAEILDRSGQPEEAKGLYSKAADRFGAELERAPRQLAYVSSLAVALAKAGRLDEAVKAHEDWIVLESEAGQPTNNSVVSLGTVLARAGRAQEAEATLARLPQQDPQSVREAALTFGALLYEQEDAQNAEPLLRRALGDGAVDEIARKAEGYLVGLAAKRLDLDATAVELRKYLAMEPDEVAVGQVGDIVKEKFLSAADASAPRVLKLARPRYPKDARQDNIKADVSLLVQIGPDGKFTGESVLVPNRIWKELQAKGFVDEAVEAVRRSRFVEGLGADGKPAVRWAFVTISFEP